MARGARAAAFEGRDCCWQSAAARRNCVHCTIKSNQFHVSSADFNRKPKRMDRPDTRSAAVHPLAPEPGRPPLSTSFRSSCRDQRPMRVGAVKSESIFNRSATPWILR